MKSLHHRADEQSCAGAVKEVKYVAAVCGRVDPAPLQPLAPNSEYRAWSMRDNPVSDRAIEVRCGAKVSSCVTNTHDDEVGTALPRGLNDSVGWLAKFHRDFG
jgi:hypothetical protein